MSRKYRCIIPHCGFVSEGSAAGTHLFPTSRLDVREKWANAAQLSLQDVKSSHRICRNHFDPVLDYHPTSKNLLPSAVPSKLLVSSLQPAFYLIFLHIIHTGTKPNFVSKNPIFTENL